MIFSLCFTNDVIISIPDNDFRILDTCKCISYLSCPWSKKVYELITKGAPLVQVFKVNICDNQVKLVWCCVNSKGESVYPASNEHLNILVSQFHNEYFN